MRYFETFFANKSKECMGGKSKVKQHCSALIKTLGMPDKKGNTLYEPEPLPTWRRRKLFVEKRLIDNR